VTKGTASRTAEQIAAQIEGAGGSLSASSDADVLTVSADVLSDRADLAFELLGDVTRHATFPADEVELARTRTLSALQVELSQPGSVASRFFAKEIYGRNPYGRRPTSESLRSLTRDDVVTFAGGRLRPAGALLVVAGDLTLVQAQALARTAFGGWTGAPATVALAPAPPTKTGTDILLVNRRGSVQANIVIGNTTFPPPTPATTPLASRRRCWAAAGLPAVPDPPGAEELDVRCLRRTAAPPRRRLLAGDVRGPHRSHRQCARRDAAPDRAHPH